jgi:hypothetical protein
VFEIEPPGLPEGGQTAVRFVDPLRPQTAPRLVLRCEVDADCRIHDDTEDELCDRRQACRRHEARGGMRTVLEQGLLRRSI